MKQLKSTTPSTMGASKIKRHGRIIQPKANKLTSLTVIKALLWNLKDNYDSFVHQIELEAVPKPLQTLLTTYCKSILDCIQQYPISKDGKVRKSGEEKVISLGVALKSFDDEYTGYLDKYKKDKKLSIGKKVNHLICDLNGDVNWFVKQHQLEYHSVKVTNWLSSNPTHEEIAEFVKKEGELIKAEKSRKKVLAHRPKDWELRKFFKNVTEKFQRKNGVSKFIPYKKFCKLLEKHNEANKTGIKPLKISTKGYYKIRKSWENKLFDHYI